MAEMPLPAEIFDIYEIDEEDGDERVIGQADYAADGRLTLTACEPERAGHVSDAFARVNAKDTISEITGASSAASRFTLGATTVARGTPEFLDALQGHLIKYFGIRLG